MNGVAGRSPRCSGTSRSTGCCSAARCSPSSATGSPAWRCRSRCCRSEAASATWRWCRRPSSCRSWCWRCPPGCGPTGTTASGSWSPPTWCGWSPSSTAGLLLLAGRADVVSLVAARRDVRRRRRVLRPGVHRAAAVDRDAGNLQPANALRGLTFSVGAIAGPVLAGAAARLRGRARVARCCSTRRRSRSGRAAAPAAAAAWWRRGRRGGPGRRHRPLLGGLRDGWREVRSRAPGCWRSWPGWRSYHAVVLPSVFVIGPVLAARRAGRRPVLGADHRAVRDRLHARRPAVPALAAAGSRSGSRALMLVGASCQAAFIGSGLGTGGSPRSSCWPGSA